MRSGADAKVDPIVDVEGSFSSDERQRREWEGMTATRGMKKNSVFF